MSLPTFELPFWDSAAGAVDGLLTAVGADRNLGAARSAALLRALAIQYCGAQVPRWVPAEDPLAALDAAGGCVRLADAEEQYAQGLCERLPDCYWSGPLEAGAAGRAPVFADDEALPPPEGAMTARGAFLELEAWLDSSHYALAPGMVVLALLLGTGGLLWLQRRQSSGASQRFQLPDVGEMTVRDAIEWKDGTPHCRNFCRLVFLLAELAVVLGYFAGLTATLTVVAPADLDAAVAVLDAELLAGEAVVAATSAKVWQLHEYAPAMSAAFDDYEADANSTAAMDLMLGLEPSFAAAEEALAELVATPDEWAICAGVNGCLNASVAAGAVAAELSGAMRSEFSNLTALYDSLQYVQGQPALELEAALLAQAQTGDAALLLPWGRVSAALSAWRAAVASEARLPQAAVLASLVLIVGSTLWALLAMALHAICRGRYALDIASLHRATAAAVIVLCCAMLSVLNMFIVELLDQCRLIPAAAEAPGALLVGGDTPASLWAANDSVLLTDGANYNVSGLLGGWAGSHLDWSLNTRFARVVDDDELQALAALEPAAFGGESYRNQSSARTLALADLNEALLSAACNGSAALDTAFLDAHNETAGAAILAAAYPCALDAEWAAAAGAHAWLSEFEAMLADVQALAAALAQALDGEIVPRLDDAQGVFRRSFWRQDAMATPRSTARELLRGEGSSAGLFEPEMWLEAEQRCDDATASLKVCAAFALLEPLVLYWLVRRVQRVAMRMDVFRLKTAAAREVRPNDPSQYKVKNKKRLKMPESL